MRHAAVLALALVMSAARPADAAVISIDAKRDGDAVDIHASVVLGTDVATAWRVLTDYGRYAEFIPDLHRSRVVARRDSTVMVEQTGYAALWRLEIPLSITFEIDELAPGRLQSRAVAGSLRSLTSSYTLTQVAQGTRLDYVGRVAPGFDFLADLEQSTVERNIARQFQALADEIERQGTVERPPPKGEQEPRHEAAQR